MSVAEPQPAAPKPKLRWFQFSLRTLLVATTLFAVLCSLFSWQVKRAQFQKQCVAAIRNRGGHVHYDYKVANWYASSPVPKYLLDWLGEDFFHRVVGVQIWVLLPCDWEPDREEVAFDEGCLVPGTTVPNGWERHGSHGIRKIIWPTSLRLSADDWARAALRQCRFGCDRVSIHVEYCRNALKLDPHNIEANLLLGEASCEGADDKSCQAYLETVLACAKPESLEYCAGEEKTCKGTLDVCGAFLAGRAGWSSALRGTPGPPTPPARKPW